MEENSNSNATTNFNFEELFSKVDKARERNPSLRVHETFFWENYVTEGMLNLALQDKCPFCESSLKSETVMCSDFGATFTAAQQGYNECKPCNFKIGWFWADTLLDHHVLGPEDDLGIGSSAADIIERIRKETKQCESIDSKDSKLSKDAAEAIRMHAKMERDKKTAREAVAHHLKGKYLQRCVMRAKENRDKKTMPRTGPKKANSSKHANKS